VVFQGLVELRFFLSKFQVKFPVFWLGGRFLLFLYYYQLIKDNIESAPEAAKEQVLATLDLEIEKTKVPWKRSLLRVIPKDRMVTKTILMYVFQRGQENLLDRAIGKLILAINTILETPLTQYTQKIEFLHEHGDVNTLNSVIEEINKEIEADHHHRHLLPL
jgi:hypothetical protein